MRLGVPGLCRARDRCFTIYRPVQSFHMVVHRAAAYLAAQQDPCERLFLDAGDAVTINVHQVEKLG